jgi:hypothetical protein
MAKEKTSKTNVTARLADKAAQAQCRFCGNKVETVLRLPAAGRRYMARVCCEKAGIGASA